MPAKLAHMQPPSSTLPVQPLQRRRFAAAMGMLSVAGLPIARAQDARVYKLVYADNYFAPYVFTENGKLKGTLLTVMGELLSTRLKLALQIGRAHV